MRIPANAKLLIPIFMACVAIVQAAPATAVATPTTAVAAPATAVAAPSTEVAAPATKTAPAKAAPAAASTTGAPSAHSKSCDDLKASLEAKLTAKGVKTFALEIVPKEKVGNAKVIGTCQAGAKKITYSKG